MAGMPSSHNRDGKGLSCAEDGRKKSEPRNFCSLSHLGDNRLDSRVYVLIQRFVRARRAMHQQPSIPRRAPRQPGEMDCRLVSIGDWVPGSRQKRQKPVSIHSRGDWDWNDS